MTSNLEPVDPSDKEKTSMPFNLGSQQLLATNKQYAQADVFPRFHPMIPIMPLNVRPQQMFSADGRVQASTSVSNGSYQLASANKEFVQTGMQHNTQVPMVNYMGYQQSSSNRFPLEKASSLNVQNILPVNVGGQLTASKKRPAQREKQPKCPTPMPVNVGPHPLATQKRSLQMIPPPKGRSESFETVRSKLRESLVAALAMASNQKNKPQLEVNSSLKETPSTQDQEAVGKEEIQLSLEASNPSVCKSSSEISTSKEQVVKGESQDGPKDADPSNNAEARKHDASEDQQKPINMEDEVQFSSNTIMNDELLQEYGLCWASEAEAENSEATMNQESKRPKLAHHELIEGPKQLPEEVTGVTEDRPNQVPGSLATKIEAELFRLFGGVNKKYKEKGRSLLFNLKDPNNPELRERVLSGDIAPDRLCSMTAEELASKELSEWRLAKAEEFAQMVVLPDSDVDIRRLVRKTHKGEFQVEVEHDDSASVEVAIRADMLSYIPTKVNEEAQTQSKSNESKVISKSQQVKASEELLSEKANVDDQHASNLDNLLSEKSDFMQDLMVDELKDTKSLPPVVSLDEFMEALHSEPPFENLSMENAQDITDTTEKNSESLEPEMKAESDSLATKSHTASDSSQDNLYSKLNPSDTVLEGSVLTAADINTRETSTDNTSTMGSADKVNVLQTRPDGGLKSSSLHGKTDALLPDITSESEHIWDGLVQLNISAVCTVVGYFRSGEKTSTQEWPKLLEIKGRVRLDAFEKFLQELRLSRSRAIMVAQFCWKDGSDENGRLHLCETTDSYVIDERVGFAEPIPSVELYFCPPHPRTIEMLGKHLPQDHTNTLQSIVNGLIGVVVWRRPHVNTVSPRMPSHHKHGSSKKVQFSTNRQKQNIVNSKSTPSRSSRNPQFHPGEEPIDDIPPGFGPATTDKDDLPEFDFAHNSVAQTPPPAAPVEKMRALIQKYGGGESAGKPPGVQPWNGADDIPEWRPQQVQQPLPQPQQLPPPPPLPHQNYNYPQQVLQQPLIKNQQFGLNPMYQLMPQSHPQPQQLLMSNIPQMQMGTASGQPSANSAQWWSPPAWGPAGGAMGVGLPMGGMMQPCTLGGQPGDVQFYGLPPPLGSVQTGMGWRPDIPRGRGG